MSWSHSITVEHYFIWSESTREVSSSEPDHIELVDVISMFNMTHFLQVKTFRRYQQLQQSR